VAILIFANCRSSFERLCSSCLGEGQNDFKRKDLCKLYSRRHRRRVRWPSTSVFNLLLMFSLLILGTGGRGNIIPGTVMFAIFGATGQAFYNRVDARNPESSGKTKDLKDSWLNSKWSPMKVLSDADYEKMLQEKLLKVNAEIALVDENIATLRVQEEDLKAKKEVDKPESS
jgi:hypothetical protein